MYFDRHWCTQIGGHRLCRVRIHEESERSLHPQVIMHLHFRSYTQLSPVDFVHIDELLRDPASRTSKVTFEGPIRAKSSAAYEGACKKP